MSALRYQEFTTRISVFVSEDEQIRLHKTCAFVCCTGGIGRSALAMLIRAEVGRLTLGDLGGFEVSNPKRQVFATLKVVEQDTAGATGDQCLEINPEAEYVLSRSSSRHHFDRVLTIGVTPRTRSRTSFAPMVVRAGTLMRGVALQGVLDCPRCAGYRGWFLNPRSGSIERPSLRFLSALMRPVARRQLKRLLTE